MLRGRPLLAVIVSLVGATAFCFAGESGTPEQPAPVTVVTKSDQKSAQEIPIAVSGSHLPDIVMPDEIRGGSTPQASVPVAKSPAIPSVGGSPSKDANDPRADSSDVEKFSASKNILAPQKGGVAAPAVNPGSPIADPAALDANKEKVVGKPDEKVAAKPDEKPAVAATAPATASAPASGQTVEYVKSGRAECDDEEMEQIYQIPDQIEGFAGWKRNKKRRDVQLIDQDMIGIADRWRIGIPKDSRHTKGNLWDPYHQNIIKGDYPIMGQSIFLNAAFTSDTLVEGHSVPTASGVSAQRPGSFNFFGRGDQFIFQQNFEISLELFKGETEFKPKEWAIEIAPVFNVNYASVQENFALNIDPRRGATRFDS